jgi:hypothetical protein
MKELHDVPVSHRTVLCVVLVVLLWRPCLHARTHTHTVPHKRVKVERSVISRLRIIQGVPVAIGSESLRTELNKFVRTYA